MAHPNGIGKTVLIIDDDVQIRLLLRENFAVAGWTVLEADEAVYAVELIAQHSRPFTALVVDVRMPGPSGIDLIRALKESSMTRNTVIAVITGHAGREEEGALKVLKPDVVYRKPFNPEDLIDLIDAALNRKEPVKRPQ